MIFSVNLLQLQLPVIILSKNSANVKFSKEAILIWLLEKNSIQEIFRDYKIQSKDIGPSPAKI